MRAWGWVILVLAPALAFGQTGAPVIPTHFSLEVAADFDTHQALARKSMIWLLQEPLEAFPEKRTELNAFAMMWLSGHPSLRLEVNSSVIPGLREHDALFPVFTYGMALYQMLPTGSTDDLTLHVEGLRAVERMVSQTKSLRRDRTFRPLRKAVRQGRLEAYTKAAMGLADPPSATGR